MGDGFGSHAVLSFRHMSYEGEIVSSLNQWVASSAGRTAVAIFMARWLLFVFILLGAHLVFFGKKTDRHAVFEGVWGFFLVLGITALLSRLIGRIRPFSLPSETLVPIRLLIPPPYNLSFPSGHMGTATVLAAALTHARRGWAIPIWILTGLIGFGRVAAGVHYPTDILGGFGLGWAVFALVRVCHAELRQRDLSLSVRMHHHD